MQAARPFGSAGELVEPVAQEGGFGRPEREGALVCCAEVGSEGEGAGGEAGVHGRGRFGGKGAVEGSRILVEISGSQSSAGALTSDRVTPVTAARRRRAARSGREPEAAVRSRNFSRRSRASSAADGRRQGRPAPYINTNPGHLRANVAAAEIAENLTGAEVARLTGLVDGSKAVLDQPHQSMLHAHRSAAKGRC